MLPRRHDRSQAAHPRFVVWELTLACDQRCAHCGSRAAEARVNELTTEEALDVVHQLEEMGTRELALIGGEAYLHRGFLEVVARANEAGMRVTMTTGGRGITAELARAMASAGMHSVSVSIDGLPETHDLVRATRGSFESAIAALERLRDAGMRIGCNSVVNSLNCDELERLYDLIEPIGITAWQVQLMAALGRAADRPDLLVQPWQLTTLLPRLAELKRRAYGDGILLSPGNNIGYFSHDETLLRSLAPDGNEHWGGCVAGRYVMGIESDGAVKGCPSLPTRGYVGGTTRDKSLRQLWSTPEVAFARRRSVEDLWGFCRQCPFASECLGGCTFTAHALLGRPGNNPYCHFRVKTLADRGLRERLVPVERAPGEPFDHGTFALVVESVDEPLPEPIPRKLRLRVWPG